MDAMHLSRLLFLTALMTSVLVTACSPAPLPDVGALKGTSQKLAVTGEYKPLSVDAVERLTLENGKLVVHGQSTSVTLDAPPAATPEQKTPGWALVTEGESETARSLTFTHEMSLDDFTIEVPPSPGQVAYGTLTGKDKHDVLVFAYGTGSKCYWGWVDIGKP